MQVPSALLFNYISMIKYILLPRYMDNVHYPWTNFWGITTRIRRVSERFRNHSSGKCIEREDKSTFLYIPSKNLIILHVSLSVNTVILQDQSYLSTCYLHNPMLSTWSLLTKIKCFFPFDFSCQSLIKWKSL